MLAAEFGIAAVGSASVSIITIDLCMVAPSGGVAEVIGTRIAVIACQRRVYASG